MTKKTSLFLIGTCALFWLLCQQTLAQGHKTIRGKVVDAANNQPIGGATVYLRNFPKTGTTTDENGSFTLAVPSTGKLVLVFSSIGYAGREVPLGNIEVLNVRLDQGSGELNEVVVTGYTSEKKKDLTGAVSVVNLADMTRQPSGLVTDQLQGQASGLTVIGSGQPGEDPQIRIRGINTFGNNVPLFVVDGVPTQNIADLNPSDIASIQVLKDAGASSIYGARASNGVIIITTKTGKGRLSVHYDAYYGEQYPKGGNPWHILSPQDQANYEWESQTNQGIVPNDPLYGKGTTPVLPDYIDPLGAHEGDPSVNPALYYVNPDYTSVDDYNSFYRITKANKSGTDWFHQVFKPAPITNHNLSVTGAANGLSYLFSLSYFDQQGTLIDTYLKRYTVRSNTKFEVTKNIHIGEDLSYSITHNPNRINVVNQYAGGSPIFYAMAMPPIIPVYDIKGNYAGTYGTPNFTTPNPVAALQRGAGNQQTGNRLFGNVYADVTFLKYFTVHTSFGGENASTTASNFIYPTYENAQNQTTNEYVQTSDATVDWTWTNTLTFNKKFGKDHDVKVLVGTEAYKYNYSNMGATTQGYFSFDPNYVTLSSGSGTETNSGGRDYQSLSSEFGRLDYSFRDKYLVSGTLRRDGSSVFVNQKYGVFPSVSAAWRLSQENFMRNISWLTDLKIRGSWGIMGNQLNVSAGNGYYTYLSNNSSSYYDIGNTNNTNAPGFQIGQIANPDAKWEQDINSNIGLDATFLNGAITLSADYYKKVISGLLYNPPLLGTEGAGTAPSVNIAGTNNTGFDLSVSGRKNISRDFRITGSVNVTTYHNIITRVTDNTNYFVTNDKRQFGDYFIQNQVGHSIGAFYGYKITGFWNTQDEINQADALAQKNTGSPTAIYQTGERPGFFRYADVDGDGQITTADRTFIGNPNPKFTYGLNLDLSYKSFDLNMTFYGVQGNQIWNDVLAFTDLSGTSTASLYNHWTTTNYNAKTPLPGTYAQYQGTPNSYFIENGSYLKLKNLQLGYTIPSTKLKAVGIQNLRVYLQGANLFTLTKYTGLDPEISGSVTDFGVDEAIYPNQRQLLVGLNLTF